MDTPRDIEAYKPNPSVASTFEVDERLPDAELTFDLFKKLVLARKTQDFVFLSIGKMLKIVRDRKLYKYLDFENFSQFLASEEISFSREKAYLYIRTFELYIEKLQMNPDTVGEMGVVRLMMMAPIVKNMSKEDAAAKMEELGGKGVRYGDFVRQVKQHTNTDGKPTVYFSEESKLWVINYFENTTHLVPLGVFTPPEKPEEKE
jgi:hypothetical protein